MKPTPVRLRDTLPGTLAGMIERVRIGATGRLWQLLGFGDRSRGAEVYQGVGITARPPAGSGAAIVAYPDGTQSPVIIAASDPDNAFEVQADETAIHTTEAVVYVKADGSVEIRSRGGMAVALATKADADAIKAKQDEILTYLAAHVHTVQVAPLPSPPTPSSPPVTPPPAPGAPPVGTQKLKAE